MKFTTNAAVTLSLLASSAHAHYIFQSITIGGTESGVYEFVRENTNHNSPVEDLTSPALRCNEGGADGSGTGTVEAAAGSDFTFHSDTAVYHQGPITMYMSQAPSTAADYDGSGDWFKINEIGPTFEGDSASWDMSDSYTGTIPASVPDGEYLLRIEQLGLHNPGAPPQFYVGCAQVKVTGGGGGSPSPVVSIPGHVSADDPGYTANIYTEFTSYEVPGPAVWTG